MMKRSINIFKVLLLSVPFMAAIVSCKKETYSLPEARTQLQNDAIKRTLGPNIVGQQIEFAYAMAQGYGTGKIVSAQVEATIAGATGTYLENKSYLTKSNGQDSGVVISTNTSVTDKGMTSIAFTKDTNAATLRYFYVIPEEARGKTVSFTFSAKNNDGNTVSYKMGPYTISKMDMVTNLAVTNADQMYISLADMRVYNAAGAASNAAKIDLVYLYRALPTVTFTHALVSPAADAQYLPDITLPAGVNRSTKVQKVFNLQDYNLAKTQFGIYVDDLDFQQLNLNTAPNFAINLRAEAGVWAETADGKYRAYVYINSADNTNRRAVISIKRYTMN
jgi:hypothetical protein